MSSTPEISLLIPVYNVERYLRPCLQSARWQTFSDIEVICINDGSTDDSRSIIEEFLSDERFRVIDKPNSGYGASMNCGLRAARGRYIAILESDDFLDEDALSRMHRVAIEWDAQVVKADFYLHWSHPKPRDERFGLVVPSLVGKVMRPEDDPRIFYAKPSIWSALYRADFLKENGIGFLETPGASYQDSSFNFKVWTSADRVAFMPEAFLHYRQDNESSSVNSPGKAYCVCDECAEMERFLAARPEKEERLRPVLLKVKYDSYLWNYERLSPRFQLEFLRRVAEEFGEHAREEAFAAMPLEPWKREDLCRILASPERYHRRRAAFARFGRAGKMLHYLAMGGPSMLSTIARTKRESGR